MNKRLNYILLALIVCLLNANTLLAQGGPKPPSALENPFVQLLVVVIALFAIIIGILGRMVIKAAFLKIEKEKASWVKNGIVAVLIFGLLNISPSVFAEAKTATATATEATKVVDNGLNGISDTAFYLLSSVVGLEALIVVALLLILQSFVAVEKEVAAEESIVAAPAKPKYDWWEKINSFRPIHQEADIDLEHNYDGIRELDNRLPPWWLYGFYCCILFAVIYLWRYHVAQDAPLSKEEYEIAVADAEVAKQAYLENAASNVDENTVKLIPDASELAAAKGIFETTCSACHGKKGEGGVGPNLTDDFWIHGGSVQDVFKTIKYGWPDKGMKSWKDDYSPVQIAQLTSYVKLLHGTNPPNGKAAQGTLFIEQPAAAPKGDSTKKDSSVVAVVK